MRISDWSSDVCSSDLVKKAVANVEGPLARVVTGLDAQEQAVVDQAMIDADGTANKSKLGANAILAVSLATAKADAEENFLPLFQHLGGISSVTLPEIGRAHV